MKKSKTEGLLNYSELMEELQRLLNSSEVSAEENPQMRENQEFWKVQMEPDIEESEETVGVKEVLKETLQQQAEKLFELIKENYLKGAEYQEFAKHLRKKGSVEEEGLLPEAERLFETDGSLFDDIIGKIQDGDTEVPKFIYAMISFFDQISKLPLEKQKHFLAQFPPKEERDYQCTGGAQTRLGQVALQISGVLGNSFEIVIENSSSDLSKLVRGGNEIHVHSALQEALGLKTQDAKADYPIVDLPAERIWKFVKTFNSELAVNLKLLVSREMAEIDEIKTAFDVLMSKADAQGVLDLNDISPFQQLMEKYWQILEVSQGAAFTSKFFDVEDDLDFTLKRVANSQETAVDQALMKLREKVDLRIESQNQEGINFNLYDEYAPEQIVAILKNSHSTDYQKNLALNALLILSGYFAGNSPISLIRTLRIIGNYQEGEEIDETLGKVKEFLGKFQGSFKHSVEGIVANIEKDEQKLVHQYFIDNRLTGEEGLSVQQSVDLGLPKKYLDGCVENDTFDGNFPEVFDALLKRKAHVSLIFYHPQRDQILDLISSHRASLYHTNEDGQMTNNTSAEILNYVQKALIKIAIDKQDPDLLRKLRENKLFDISSEQFCEYFVRAVIKENRGVINELALNEDLIGDLFVYGSSNNNLEFLEYLIDKGLDIDSVNQNGFSALMMACQKGNSRIVNFLLDKGADVNIQGTTLEFGAQTALALAAQKGVLKIVESLLNRGANVDFQDSSGSTAIDYASKYGRVEVVSFLLDRVNDESKFEALNSAMNSHNPNSEICGIIWDHLSVQVNQQTNEPGIMQDQSGNSFAHLIVVSVNSPNFKKNKKEFTKHMFGELSKKPYFNPMQTDGANRTAIEFAFEAEQTDVAKTMFEMLSTEQQIMALNRTTQNNKAETVGNFLLEVMDKNLDHHIKDLEPRAPTFRRLDFDLEDNIIPAPAIPQADKLNPALRDAVNNNAALSALPKGSAVVNKISRLQALIAAQQEQ